MPGDRRLVRKNHSVLFEGCFGQAEIAESEAEAHLLGNRFLPHPVRHAGLKPIQGFLDLLAGGLQVAFALQQA